MIERPLVVDLDGTLVSTDLLIESASAMIIKSPLSAPLALRWMRGGKERLKRELAVRSGIDASALPYRSDLLDWLRAEHVDGRRLILASASNAKIVQQVADHLGIFEEAHGSHAGVNLKASAKRDLLIGKFGHHGFDYVGNHRDDLEVWAAGETAHVVGGDRLVAQAASVSKIGRTFSPSRHRLRPIIKALRPHQWVKNALLAVPLLTAHLLGDWSAVWRTVMAIVAFTLVAASVYVLNDLADVVHDRHHPQKRFRPFASGELSLGTGWVLWPILAIAGFTLAASLLSWQFVVVLSSYLIATALYTFWAKRKAVGDVALLACLYSIRIIAGAVAIEVPLSLWLLTFSLLFFLSLALVKRVSELRRIRHEVDHSMEAARGRGYIEGDLELLSSYGVATSISAVVVFALFIQSPTTTAIYATPEFLWATVPTLLTWLMRVWLLSHRGEMNEDPVLFASKDWRSILAGQVVVASFLAAKLIEL